MAKITQLPLAAPITVMPAPSPTEVGVEAISDGQGGKMVVMQFATRHGVQFYFISCEAARQIADAMTNAAGGILIVPSGAMPPRG